MKFKPEAKKSIDESNNDTNKL